MPNIADTKYNISGDKEKINLIEETYLRLSKDIPEYLNVSLFDFVTSIYSFETMNANGTPKSFRGSIYGIERPSDNVINLFCETAWDWCPDFVHLLENHDFIVKFTCIEPGEDIFVTNDETVQLYRVFCGSVGFDEITEHLSEVISYLQEHLHKKVPQTDNIKTLYKFIEKHNKLKSTIVNDNFITLAEIEYITDY